jgi:hypothetical protein
MDTAAKIIYVAQAVVFTAGGIFYLQAAGSVGEGAVYWFGVDAYLWVGVASLVVGLAGWVLLCFRPDLRGS